MSDDESGAESTMGAQQWFVTAPASPASYAQYRVYEGPMSADEAEKVAARKGDRYSATREGTLTVAKVVDRRE